MPINLPNLDDRTFDDLVTEALAMIPSHAPEWTNYNESDPGITLVELFAYLTEMLIYRQNRISDANVCSFLKLMDGVKRIASPNRSGYVVRDGVKVSLEDEVREAVLTLRTQDRAVTCQDFKELAQRADARVARAHCLPRRFLKPDDAASVNAEQSGHVTVIIVPRGTKPPDGKLIPDDDLVKAVGAYLSERRLLTTRVHVSAPRYLEIAVHVTLYLKHDALEKTVRAEAKEALRKFLDPLSGGTGGNGWPFGRNVYVSEVYALLNRLPGVDYVTNAIDPKTGDPLMNDENQPYPELTVIPDDPRRRIPPPVPFDSVLITKKGDYIDVTRESAEGGAKIPLWPQTDEIGRVSIMLLGSNVTFDAVRFALSKAGQGYLIDFMFPTENGSEWVRLKGEKDLHDTTSNWSSSGLITFTPPPGWSPMVINNAKRYWLLIHSDDMPPAEVAEADLILRADDQAMEGIRLEADELVAFSVAKSHLQIIDPKSDTARPLLESLKAGQ
jgi:hypothetical protein